MHTWTFMCTCTHTHTHTHTHTQAPLSGSYWSCSSAHITSNMSHMCRPLHSVSSVHIPV
jgi:hypothetical protein